MKRLLTLFCAFAAAHMVHAETHPVGQGKLEASEDFVLKRTGTKDSFMGTLTRKGDGFVINFDIGFGAGLHMGERDKPKCSFYREQPIGGIPSATGIEKIEGGKTRIVTTIGDGRRDNGLANFWADIRSEADVTEFLLIVCSYRAK